MIGVTLKNVSSLRFRCTDRFYSLALKGVGNGAALRARMGNLKAQPTKQRAQPGSVAELSVQVETLNNTYSFEQLNQVLAASTSFALDAQNSRLLIDSVLRKAPVTDLHDLRAHLATGTNAGALQLNEALLEKAVTRCLALGDASEAMQWLLLAEEAYGTALSQGSRDAVLRASTKLRNWDAVHFLLEDRRSRCEALGADLVASILKGALQQPYGRWRVAKDLVLEMDSADLTPGALALVFRTLLGAGQHKAAHALYHRLASKVLAGESSPLFAAQVLSPLVLTAQNLNSFSFLRDAIHNCFGHLLRASSTVSADVSGEVDGILALLPTEQTAEAEAAWLLRSVRAMCTAYADAPFDVAPALGGAVGWMLANWHSESAMDLWSSYVSALEERAAESIDDESARLQGALDQALRLVASGALESTPAHLRSTASFLRSVALSPSSGSEAAPESRPGAAGQSDALLDLMMRIFAACQEVDAVSTLFSRRLQRGGLPADCAITPALQLIQQSGDHDLVLKLFNYYLSIATTRHPMTRVLLGAPKDSKKGNAKQWKSVPGAFAPPIFAAAMGSLAATGDTSAMEKLLTQEVPARGYAPREGAYVQAISALYQRGMYTEGTRLFAQSQQLYEDLVDASRAGVGFAPLGYGVGSVPLVDVALRCCAQGRLGVTALEIFQVLETAHRKGFLPLNASDVDVLSAQVLLSLAMPDYVKIIPQFLQSHRNLPIRMVTSRKALLTGLAAAVFVGDDAVAAELAQLLEASQGRPLAEVTSVDLLQASIARLFAVKDEAALLSVTGSQIMQRLR